MSSKPAGEVLYDLEAALRLVDGALREFEQPSLGILESAGATRAPQLVMEPGHQALLGVLDTLRRSRSILERAALARHAPAGDRHPPALHETDSADTAGDQLDYASAVLDDVEHRIAAIVAALGSAA